MQAAAAPSRAGMFRSLFKRTSACLLSVIVIEGLQLCSYAEGGGRLAQTSTITSPSSRKSDATSTPETAAGCGSRPTGCGANDCQASCSSQAATCRFSCIVPGAIARGGANGTTVPGGADRTATGMVATGAMGTSVPAASASPSCFLSCASEQLTCQGNCAKLPTAAGGAQFPGGQ